MHKLFGSHLERCFVVLSLSLAIAPNCLGQASAGRTNDQKQSKKEARQITELERRGLENLDRLALEARQVDNAAIRTELQSLIGDALWDFDKAYAKDIFLDAFKNARAIADKRIATVAQTQVVSRVWARDRVLAEALMKQLADNGDDVKNDPKGDFGLASQFGMKSNSPVNQQKLELARELLEVDSGAAADLINKTLQNDVSFAGVNLLGQLRAKNPAAADAIFQNAVGQLANMPSTAGIMAAIAMGDYLAPSCVVCSPAADAPNTAAFYASALAVLRKSLGQPYAPPPVKSDLQDRLRQYLHEMQATLAMTLSKFATPTDLPQLEAIYQQQVEMLDPLKQRKLEALRNMQRSPDKFEDLRKGADALSDEEERDKALSALVEGGLRQNPSDERLAKIGEMVDSIHTPEIHDRAWSLLKRLEVVKLTRMGKFEDAYSLALKLPHHGIRAQALRDLSLAVTRKGSLTLSGEDVLTQALEAVNKAGASIETSRLMFSITSDFVNLKVPEKAFSALQNATESFAGLKRDDFEEALKASAPNSLFDYRNTFGRLGNIDFDRAMFLAQSIKWREFRLAAEIVTCQSVLSRKG